MALERHATSKLRAFRRPSRHRELRLSRRGAPGHRVGVAVPAAHAAGGRGAGPSRSRWRTGSSGKGGRPVGRRGRASRVADLFAAVPARRKFLKREATEWSHAADWLSRAALTLPGVHFDVVRKRPAGHELAGGGRPARPHRGRARRRGRGARSPSRAATTATWRSAPTSRGPTSHRATGKRDLPVRERPARARQDHASRAPPGDARRAASADASRPQLIFLDVASDAVDVNVHPAKWEVRFADAQAIHRLVASAVRDAMAERGWNERARCRGPAVGHRRGGSRRRGSPPGRTRARDPARGAWPARRRPSDWIFAEPAAGHVHQASSDEPDAAGGPPALPVRRAAGPGPAPGHLPPGRGQARPGAGGPACGPRARALRGLARALAGGGGRPPGGCSSRSRFALDPGRPRGAPLRAGAPGTPRLRGRGLRRHHGGRPGGARAAGGTGPGGPGPRPRRRAARERGRRRSAARRHADPRRGRPPVRHHGLPRRAPRGRGAVRPGAARAARRARRDPLGADLSARTAGWRSPWTAARSSGASGGAEAVAASRRRRRRPVP